MTSPPPREGQGRETARLVSQGLSLLKAGKSADLLRMIAQAGPAAQDDARILVQKAYGHAVAGQVAEALGTARLAMQAPLRELWALDLLGNTFTLCHRPTEAHAAFSRAQTAAPNHPGVLFNLAAAAGFLGRTDEAERAYDRVISASPDNAEAWLNRSQLRRQTAERNHVAELRTALDGDTVPWQREVHLRYALGKELEDLGAYDEAFTNIAQGAAVRRCHMRYAVADDIGAMARIAAVHDADWCAPAAAMQQGGGPVFILGMPRSGSTLLERMLGRHTQLQAMGELPNFGQALIAAFRRQLGRMPSSKTELVDRSADLDLVAIGSAYLSSVAPLRDTAPRFIDKLPINFLYAGLIARALPGATLLHIRRQPLDLCFAIFKTLFRDAYPFSYDFSELAAYYRAYEALMDHWRRALGGRLVEIDYEDLVSVPRNVFEPLLPQLGLDFEEACLSPEKGDAAVMTASAAQVRQPIHAGSVGSAARYGAHLDPLRVALGE